MNISELLPASVRKWIYTVGAVVFAVEGALDIEGVGLIPEKVQNTLLGVIGALGFTLARMNTRDVTVVREDDI